MAYDLTGDTTGLTNEHFTSFPQASFERDRLRLQRELDRDLNHPSFSSSSVSGLENAGRPFNLDLDETDTFDIDNDARATSTRRMNINTNMLQSSPQVNSRILAAEFADFSMAGNDYTDESLELARGRKDKSLSGQDYSRGIAYMGRNSTSGQKPSSKRLSEAYATAGKDMASPRHSRLNSMRSDLHDLRKGKESNRATTAAAAQEDTFDVSKFMANHNSQKRPSAANARQTSDGSNGGKPRKTTEQVPSRHRHSSAPPETQPEDDYSSLISIGEIIPSKTRKASKSANLRETRGPSLKAAMKAAETRETGSTKRKSTTATNAASGADVPKTFKSTAAFIQELGLDGHTATLNLQNPPTYDETLELTKEQNTDDQSFLLPNIGGISELIQQEATKIYNNGTASARKRNPNGQPPTHKPIESIPVPQDNRAILMALQLLQDQMASLKEQKAATEKRCEELKEQLKRLREKYENEHRRAQVAESEARKRRKSHNYGSSHNNHNNNNNNHVEDTEAVPNQSEEVERLKISHLVEKMKLENSINSYKTQIEEITHRAEITKIALRNMQDERNSAVNSAASAMSSQKKLLEETERLREEINTLRVERMQFETQVNRDKEAWKAKEQILRRRVDKAREAEATAREAIQGLQKKLEQQQGDKGKQKNVHASGPDTEELKNYFSTQYTQNTATSSKNYMPRNNITIHSAPATVTIPSLVLPTQKENAPVSQKATPSSSKQSKAAKEAAAKAQAKIDQAQQDTTTDTTYTVDGDYIRRIADEIEEERRRRKAAEKLAASSNAEMDRIRQIVGTNMAKSVMASSPTKKASASAAGSSSKKAAASTIRDDNTTAVKSLPPRPVSAPPVIDLPLLHQQQQLLQQQQQQSSATAAAQVNKQQKKRRIKKVVYYEDADTTEILPPAVVAKSKGAEIVQVVSAPAFANPKAPATQLLQQQQPTSSTDDLDATFRTARPNAASSPSKISPYTFTGAGGNTVTTALPPAPVLPEHIRSVIDAEAEHDPLTCTVCTRKEMQNLQEETRKAEKSANGGNGYDEASTLRPSRPADRQLSKVVRGLQDEFVHLKMAYQEKAEEFLALDPTRGKRRRKEITAEINEMVAEMDWKCDMIYALYDVVEEVSGKNGGGGGQNHRAGKQFGVGAAGKGKSPQQVNFMDLHGFDSEAEQEEFEREFADGRRRRGGNGLVDSEDESEDDDTTGGVHRPHHHHHHHRHHNGVNGGAGMHELSLLDEEEETAGGDTTKEDDTNMQVARHLAMARQREREEEKAREAAAASRHRHGRVEEVVDSYDEESTV